MFTDQSRGYMRKVVGIQRMIECTFRFFYSRFCFPVITNNDKAGLIGSKASVLLSSIHSYEYT